MDKTKCIEYRGVRDVVCAEIITDTAEKFEVGTPFSMIWVSEISKDTKESLDKTDKFFEACDKHKELLLPKKRKEAGLDGLDEAATKFNTRSVIQNSAAANIANDIKAMDSQIESNKQRKEKFKNNKTYEEILSKNNKFKNYSTEGKNDALYNAVYAHKGNNGR